MLKLHSISLMTKVTVGNILLVSLVLLLTLGITLQYSISRTERRIEENLLSSAMTLSETPAVIGMLERRQVDHELSDLLDYMISVTKELDVITIADMDSKRYFHPNKTQIGNYFVGGDEGRVLQGEHYLSYAEGTIGYQRRAFCPIYGTDGKQLGFVMASTLVSNIDSMRWEIIRIYAAVAFFTLFIGIMVSSVLTQNIKLSLLGYEPSKLAQIFLAREDLLNVLNDGIISVNSTGEIVLANYAATSILGLTPDDIVSKNITDILPELKLEAVLKDGEPQHNREVIISNNTYLCDKLPVSRGKRSIGAAVILKDKSDATRLAEQLTGSRQIINALRANTHEFMNRLHVIMGFLHTNQTDEARNYIQNICMLQTRTIKPLLDRILNPTIAALILGKISRTRELDIEFDMLSGSFLPRHSSYLSTQSLVTITGNLLDNAIEAVQGRDDSGLRMITLQIRENETCLLISVDDTGIGISPQAQEQLFIRGYSTKGSGRGLGMGLIKDALDACHGDIEVESELGTGTSIVITIKDKRPGM